MSFLFVEQYIVYYVATIGWHDDAERYLQVLPSLKSQVAWLQLRVDDTEHFAVLHLHLHLQILVLQGNFPACPAVPVQCKCHPGIDRHFKIIVELHIHKIYFSIKILTASLPSSKIKL